MSRSKVLIGVGGTGAKVLEAFTYLAVAGFPGASLSGEQAFHLRMVDTDKENGNFGRLRKLLDLLNKGGGVVSLFDGYSKQSKKPNWPIGHISHNSFHAPGDAHNVSSEFLWQIDLTKLENLEHMKNELKEANGVSRVSPLLNALYGQADMDVPQAEGFHGKPRIGALRLQYEFEQDSSQNDSGFWNALESRNIFLRDETQLMFTGSIFGGTGASGIPNLIRLCQERYFRGDNDSSLGMTLILPYYLFSNLKKECPADPSQFRLNSKLALLYYYNSNLLEQLSNPSVYLIGQDVSQNMRTEKGGDVSLHAGKGNQINPALPAELTAAIAIIDYYNYKKSGLEVRWCVPGDTENAPLNIETEFPDGRNLKNALHRLAAFSLLWTVLSSNRPDGASDLYAFRNLHKMKEERSSRWYSVLHPVDDFVASVKSWLLQLEANGTDLEWFRDSHSTLSEFLQEVKAGKKTFANCDKSIDGRDISNWLKEIDRAVGKFKLKSDDHEYLQLLYAVMFVCAEKYRYN